MFLDTCVLAVATLLGQAPSPPQVTYNATVCDSHGIIASPSLRMLDRTAGDIQFAGRDGRSYDLKITPKVNPDGSVTTFMALHESYWVDPKTQHDEHLQLVSRSQKGQKSYFLFTPNIQDQRLGVNVNMTHTAAMRKGEIEVVLDSKYTGEPGPAERTPDTRQVFFDVTVTTYQGNFNPKIRTLVGRPARLKVGSQGHTYEVFLNPTIAVEGGLATKMTFTVDGDFSVSTLFRSVSGGSTTYAFDRKGDNVSLVKLEPGKKHALTNGEADITIRGSVLQD